MAWIKVDHTLPMHRKTGRLMRRLGVPRAQAVGHMVLLWQWALDNAPDGNLAAIDAEDVADGAHWDGAPDVFVAALIDAGFVRADGMIADWEGWLQPLIMQREQARKRVKQHRARQAAHSVTDAHATSSADAYVTRSVCVTSPQRTYQEQEQEQEHIHLDTSLTIERDESTLSPATAVAVAEREGVSASEKPPAEQPAKAKPVDPAIRERFVEFWAAYPKKVNKQPAYALWSRLTPDAALHAAIMAGLAAWKQSAQWRNPQYIRGPDVWLRNRNWEDEVPVPTPVASRPKYVDPQAAFIADDYPDANGKGRVIL